MAEYYEQFEDRRPPEPVPYSVIRELLWQFLATVSLGLGLWYIVWRWGWSLNYDALWFALPLVIAESLAYFGLILFTINLWKTADTTPQPPPLFIAECTTPGENVEERPLRVDIFFPTYDEDPELVRLSILDAKKVSYPHPINVVIHVLDDGKRPPMESVAKEEGVHYITRDNNLGFKAGNLRNAMEQTYGDFIVICDADTRPFPTILEHTLGYFRDPEVAWVQTPQWFFELPPGKRLGPWLKRHLGGMGESLGNRVEKLVGPVTIGADPFVNDPQMFYDVIQRRRNWANASFCCGAGSIHRREAVMEVALRSFGETVDVATRAVSDQVEDNELREDLDSAMRRELVIETELTPYKFHVSEDMYTSLVLHSDRERNWKSVYHPPVESKMLSTQDLPSWAIQRFKYAGGTLDVLFNDNPLFKKGLSLPQKLMYGATFWSYLGCLWNVVFLLSPIIYLFTGIAPVAAYSLEFYKHILPFLICNSLAQMVGTWGISAWAGQSSYLSFFSINFRALWTVLRGMKISFPVTPKMRQEGVFYTMVWPQIGIIVLTFTGLLFATTRFLSGEDVAISGLITNIFWGLNNILAMMGIVYSAFWKPDYVDAD